MTVGKGVVVREFLDNLDADHLLLNIQELLVYFFAIEEDPFLTCRQIARRLTEDPNYEPPGMLIPSTQLVLVETDTGWLDPLSMEEMQLQRFSDIYEDISG